ncbi:MAG: hypothetical protein WDM81_19345 [Rhizomicrobium sp.]
MQSLSFVQDAGVVRDLTEGHFDTTNAPFDMAIHARAISPCRRRRASATPATAISRSTPVGQIVTSNGDPVQGDGGAITITPDDGDIDIAQDGTVSGKNGIIGKIRVVDFANERALVKEGASLYAAERPVAVPRPTPSRCIPA